MGLAPTDIAAIRAAEKTLAESFEAPDPAAWVSCYTEDAVFVGPGMEAMEGRSALLEAVGTFAISSMEIEARSTIGSGDFAATIGHASWVNAPRGTDAPRVRRRFLMVWRQEPAGCWRVARELLNDDI